MVVPIHQRVWGWGWHWGERRGTPWAARQFYHSADTWRQTTLRAHIHTYEQFRVTSQPDLHALGLWEGRSPRMVQAEHANTAQNSSLLTSTWSRTVLLWGISANNCTTVGPCWFVSKSIIIEHNYIKVVYKMFREYFLLLKCMFKNNKPV